jgi:pimeloyl-ACP methyl ester carboxylesterase
VTRDLQQVSPVETGGADANEQLAVLGLWIWAFGDLDPAVDDRGGTHAGEGTPRSSVAFVRDIGNYPDVGVQLPHLPPLWREGRAGVEAAALFRSSVWRGGGIPSGDGRPVLLIPGFMAGDGSLGTMTRWLRENDYYTRRAGIRLNVSCSNEACARLEEKIERFASDTGERVALIGQSRGGIFARALAVRRPDLVSGIVALGSPTVNQLRAHPFVLAQVAVVGALGSGRVPGMFRMSCLRGACCARFRDDMTAGFPPEVGFTALYSRTDGIVDWHACLDPAATQIEVRASHVGMAVNAEVYAEVGHALGEFGQSWARAA